MTNVTIRNWIRNKILGLKNKHSWSLVRICFIYSMKKRIEIDRGKWKTYDIKTKLLK